eukprot:12992891-Alexandrium_andersonii.AAC.2
MSQRVSPACGHTARRSWMVLWCGSITSPYNFAMAGSTASTSSQTADLFATSPALRAFAGLLFFRALLPG